MSSAVLVDTNILIYAVDVDSRFHERAIGLLSDRALEIFTTSKNVSEFLVVLTRNEEIGLSSIESLDVLGSLLSGIGLLYPTPATFKVFRELIRKHNPSGLWIHDLEIASIALAHGISTIATNNVSDFGRISEVIIRRI